MFAGRSCRQYGEIEAVLERDLLRSLISAYKAQRDAYRRTGVDSPELADVFSKELRDIITQVFVLLSNE